MKIDISKLTIKDLAHYICNLLTENKIDVVLVGGACVSIYSKNKYMSYDLDFVTDKTLKEIEPVLNTIGFKRVGRIFKNEKCDYMIDFVAYPVMVGQEQTNEFEVIKTKFGLIALNLSKYNSSVWIDVSSIFSNPLIRITVLFITDRNFPQSSIYVNLASSGDIALTGLLNTKSNNGLNKIIEF